jgi:AcrR family transcriptional regulator
MVSIYRRNLGVKVAPRLTRAERKELTRGELAEAARAVFLRRGFHAASLDEIAEEAGYTKGAVYSNFASKDELFLGVLDAHFERRVRRYTDVALDEHTLEDAYRAVARLMFDEDRCEPEWAPLLLEFWAHASRRERLRAAVVERRERFLDAIAGLIEELVCRHGAQLAIPGKEAARASGGLMRGVGVEWLLEPSTASRELFEEMHLALMSGLTRYPKRRRT